MLWVLKIVWHKSDNCHQSEHCLYISQNISVARKSVYCVFSIFCFSWRSTHKKRWKFWGHRTISWRITRTPTSTSMSSHKTYYDNLIKKTKECKFQLVVVGDKEDIICFLFPLQYSVWIGGVWWILSGKWPMPGVQQPRSSLFSKNSTVSPTGYKRKMCKIFFFILTFSFFDPQNIKLSSIKVDTRYTTTQQVVKLIGSHTISKVTVKIGDLKRTKMVRTINLYYNNRTVQAIVELKNK